MAKYKLTLTDNDTGDVLVDEQIDCLIGGTCDKYGKMTRMLYSACGAPQIACASVGAQDVIKKLETEHPEIKKITKKVNAMLHGSETETLAKKVFAAVHGEE